MAKAKTTAKAKNDKRVKHPDAALINACIDFATALQGAAGAYKVDPTDDNDFAGARDTGALRRAHKARTFIVGCAPTTFDGLRAKASAVLVSVDQDYEVDSDLVPSLANDVLRFHRAIDAGNLIAAGAEIVP